MWTLFIPWTCCGPCLVWYLCYVLDLDSFYMIENKNYTYHRLQQGRGTQRYVFRKPIRLKAWTQWSYIAPSDMLLVRVIDHSRPTQIPQPAFDIWCSTGSTLSPVARIMERIAVYPVELHIAGGKETDGLIGKYTFVCRNLIAMFAQGGLL